MYIESKVYANFFKVEKENTDKTVFGNVSIAVEVGEQDGEKKYEYDSWKASFVGKCYDKAQELENKDKITLTKFRVRNRLVETENGKKHYPSIVIFDFEKRE